MNQFRSTHTHKGLQILSVVHSRDPPTIAVTLRENSRRTMLFCFCWQMSLLVMERKNLEMRTKESDVQEEIGKKLEEKEKKCSDRRWLFVLRWCGASGKMANKKWAIYHSLKHISAKIRQELQVIIYSKSCHKQQRSKKQCRGNGIVRTLVAFWLSLSLYS